MTQTAPLTAQAVVFHRLDGQMEAGEVDSGTSTDEAAGEDSDGSGSDDPDSLQPIGGGPSRREMWLADTMTRATWLRSQIDLIQKDLRSFDSNVHEQACRAPGFVKGGVALTYKDVSFSVRDPAGEKKLKVILERCCGHFPAGSFVAIMGPSGSGKTTLLDILARKKTLSHTGEIYVNGREADNLFSRIAAYVDSADTMPAHWTVKEAIRFNFFLKGAVPVYKHFKTEVVNELVDFYLKIFGLDTVAGSKIGGDTVRGISSGQRRRVTLAKGMVTSVPLLFCDEPTSGLSSTDAEACMKVLRIQTRRWFKTVLVVIHQPRVEVARLFDRLLLLTSRPGRIVYDGPMKDAVAYWNMLHHPVPEEANPTDHFLDTVTPDLSPAVADEFATAYKVHMEPEIVKTVEANLQTKGNSPLDFLKEQYEGLSVFGQMPKVRRSRYSVSMLTQVRFLAFRKLRLMARDPVILIMQVAVPILEGAGLGFCFMGIAEKPPKGILVITGWLNMLLMGVLFGGFTGVPQLIDERILMQKEVSEALYSATAHIVVGMVLDMFVTVTRNALFITVMYMWTGLQWDWRHFGPFFCWIVAVGVVMDPIFKAAAALTKDMQTATMAGLMAVLVIAVFNGIGFVTRTSSPTVLLPLLDVSPSSLVAEQVAWSLYGDEPSVWATLHQFLGLEAASPYACGAILLAWYTLFNIIAAVGLTLIKHIEK